jgi:uncharacterized membrane-anchored protein YhcB (DUF1043 family)
MMECDLAWSALLIGCLVGFVVGFITCSMFVVAGRSDKYFPWNKDNLR